MATVGVEEEGECGRPEVVAGMDRGRGKRSDAPCQHSDVNLPSGNTPRPRLRWGSEIRTW